MREHLARALGLLGCALHDPRLERGLTHEHPQDISVGQHLGPHLHDDASICSRVSRAVRRLLERLGLLLGPQHRALVDRLDQRLAARNARIDRTDRDVRPGAHLLQREASKPRSCSSSKPAWSTRSSDSWLRRCAVGRIRGSGWLHRAKSLAQRAASRLGRPARPDFQAPRKLVFSLTRFRIRPVYFVTRGADGLA